MCKHYLSIVSKAGINYTASVNGIKEIKEIDLSSKEDIYQLANEYIFSAYQSDGRGKAGFIKTSLIFLDYDGGSTIEQFKNSIFKDYKYVIFCSKSHNIYKKGSTHERYHVLLELKKDYSSLEYVERMINNIHSISTIDGLKPDDNCKDVSRLTFPSRESGNTEPNPGLLDSIYYNNGSKYFDEDYDELLNRYKDSIVMVSDSNKQKNNKPSIITPDTSSACEFDYTNDIIMTEALKRVKQTSDSVVVKAFELLLKNSSAVSTWEHSERYQLCSALYKLLGEEAYELYFHLTNNEGDTRNWASVKKNNEHGDKGHIIRFMESKFNFDPKKAKFESDLESEQSIKNMLKTMSSFKKVEPKVEVIEPKVEVIEPKVEVIEPKVEVIEPKAEVIEPKAEVIEPKVEVIEPKAKTLSNEILKQILETYVGNKDKKILFESISEYCSDLNSMRLVLNHMIKEAKKSAKIEEEKAIEIADDLINNNMSNFQATYDKLKKENDDILKVKQEEVDKLEAEYELMKVKLKYKMEEGTDIELSQKIITCKNAFIAASAALKDMKESTKMQSVAKLKISTQKELLEEKETIIGTINLKWNRIISGLNSVLTDVTNKLEETLIEQMTNYKIDESCYNYLTDKRDWEFVREENNKEYTKNTKIFVHALQLCSKVIVNQDNSISTHSYTTAYNTVNRDVQAVIDRTFHKPPMKLKSYSYNRMVNTNNTKLRDYTIEYDRNGNVLNLDQIIESNKYPSILADKLNGLDPYYLDGTITILPTIPIPSEDLTIRDKNSELFEYFMDKFYSEAIDVKVLLKFMAQTAIERRTIGKPALLMQGPRECGKSLVLQIFKNFFGETNAKEIVVDEKYNSFRLAPIVYREETAKDRFALYNELKEITGSSSVGVRLMNTDNKTFQSDSVPILTSNNQILKITDKVENSSSNQWVYMLFSESDTPKDKYNEISKYRQNGEKIDKILSRFFVDWLYTKGFKVYFDILESRKKSEYRYGFEIPVTSQLLSLMEDSVDNTSVNLFTRLINEVREDMKFSLANPRNNKLKATTRLFLKGFIRLSDLNFDNDKKFNHSYIKDTFIKSKIILNKEPVRKDFDGTKVVHFLDLQHIKNIPVIIELLSDFDIDFDKGTYERTKVVQSGITSVRDFGGNLTPLCNDLNDNNNRF